MMELKAWRDAVSFGAYLQPIHLQVDQLNTIQAGTSKDQTFPSHTTPNSCISSVKPASAATNGISSPQQLPEACSSLDDAQPATKLPNETSNVTFIPPFTCKDINGGEQMALNVGGPVWAMDWLPSKPATAAASVKTNSTKPQQSSKEAQRAAFKGKENIETEILDSTGVNESTELEEDLILEWRYLALATHPPCQVKDGIVVKPTPPDHYYDAREGGRNLIQIWAVPVPRPKPTLTIRKKSGKGVKPRMVYAIDHESGVAWDLQWCPLMKKFPKSPCRETVLGILAVCFGDGSMKVFEIPITPIENLQREQSIDKKRVVERNVPLVVACLPRIMQLSVQWCPHSWFMLLTGGSDGSVALWNIKVAISESDSRSDSGSDSCVEPDPIEPQRRFQDADTIGKQEAFDWGCGWVAIRAVSWSPFDEHLFATTGNDSMFKVWDVREPRVCLRSHRIRSTWGLALQWMDQTSIQISGDQGSVFMYDILSGSYQKLHFHPQIDSPVWDLQLARRGAVPLLISACTSGSIRLAPAKKLYRAPQNCVEICRLSGERDATIEKPFKSLRASFGKISVLGSAESMSQSTREFCERDAALHRLRLSSITSGDYPCFLAAGGHAGLVILFEMQEVLDTLIPNFFLPPLKNTGRPKKVMNVPRKKPRGPTEPPAGIEKVGRKTKKLGSFAKAKGMHTALSKYKKKALGISKEKARRNSNAEKKSFVQNGEEMEVDHGRVKDDEPEFDEDEDESDVSLQIEDNSDDDRVSISDGIIEEEEEATGGNEAMRLIKDYHLDLSEEDAILLAIQMSKEPIDKRPFATASSEASATMIGDKKTEPPSISKLKTRAAVERVATLASNRRRNHNKQDDVLHEATMETFIEPLEEKQPAAASTKMDKMSGSCQAKAAKSTIVCKTMDTSAQSEQPSSLGNGKSMTDEEAASHNVEDVAGAKEPAAGAAKGEQPTKHLKNSRPKAKAATNSKAPRRSVKINVKADTAAKKIKKPATAVRRRQSNNTLKEDAIQLAIELAKEPIQDEQLRLGGGKSVAASPASAELSQSGKRKRCGNTSGLNESNNCKQTITTHDRQSNVDQCDTRLDEVEANEMSEEAAFATVKGNGKKVTKNVSCNQGKGARKPKKNSTKPRGERRKSDGQSGIMTEKEAFLLTLAISELEY